MNYWLNSNHKLHFLHASGLRRTSQIETHIRVNCVESLLALLHRFTEADRLSALQVLLIIIVICPRHLWSAKRGGHNPINPTPSKPAELSLATWSASLWRQL